MPNTFAEISGVKRSLHVQVAREIARKILSGDVEQNEIIPGEMASKTPSTVGEKPYHD